MYIEEYNIEVFDSKWNDKTKKMSKEKFVVASLKDTTGICSKHLGKFLDDLTDHPTFRGEKITLNIKIEKGDE